MRRPLFEIPTAEATMHARHASWRARGGRDKAGGHGGHEDNMLEVHDARRWSRWSQVETPAEDENAEV